MFSSGWQLIMGYICDSRTKNQLLDAHHHHYHQELDKHQSFRTTSIVEHYHPANQNTNLLQLSPPNNTTKLP